MSTIRLTVTYDVEAAITEAIEQADFSGLGPDGSSEYHVESVEVDGDQYTVILERDEGKFVSNDELAEVISEGVNTVDLVVEFNG